MDLESRSKTVDFASLFSFSMNPLKEKKRQHWEAGILGTRVEKLVANLASSMSGCPEVSVLGKEAWAGRGFLKDNSSTRAPATQVNPLNQYLLN